MVVLSSISALYAGLAPLWGLPDSVKVVGTIALVQLFLGSIIGISTLNYNKQGGADAVFTVNTADPNRPIFNVDFNKDPIDLAGNKVVRMRVNRIDA